jgi:hypothetical protein
VTRSSLTLTSAPYLSFELEKVQHFHLEYVKCQLLYYSFEISKCDKKNSI